MLDISGQNSWWRLCTSSLWTVFPPSYIRRLRAWILAWIVARDYIHINVFFAFFLTICPQTNACNFTKPLGVHNASFPANLVSSVIFMLFAIFINKKNRERKTTQIWRIHKSWTDPFIKIKKRKINGFDVITSLSSLSFKSGKKRFFELKTLSNSDLIDLAYLQSNRTHITPHPNIATLSNQTIEIDANVNQCHRIVFYLFYISKKYEH